MSEYVQGKVYLQDVRSGAIYHYERYLAQDKNFKAIVPNPVPEPEVTQLPKEQEVPLS